MTSSVADCLYEDGDGFVRTSRKVGTKIEGRFRTASSSQSRSGESLEPFDGPFCNGVLDGAVEKLCT
jgi:hypothetical protein